MSRDEQARELLRKHAGCAPHGLGQSVKTTAAIGAVTEALRGASGGGARTLTYRGWAIHQGSWPEPTWMATGPNYDASYEGPEDGWVDNGQKADGSTIQQIMTEIDGWFDEHGDEA